MADRLAVDIGGTFTDVVLETGHRHVTTKVLTTHAEPADGVMEGFAQVLDQAGTDPDAIGVVLHGTTLATNALIERRGARTVLVTTAGHRDVLEMAFENRFEQYDVNIDRPQPLVPRRWRLTVPERMNAAGEVLTPLDPAGVEALVPQLVEEGIESVAVGFLHGYANPTHERLVRDVLATAMPDLSITLASDVCPEIREFERFSTACANAYVKPLMSRYLADLRDRLSAFGVGCPFLMMTSGGGLCSVETAREFPIRLVESGPAGGAILAARIAAELKLPGVVSLDMGGTTAKICLIDDGAPLLSRSFEVDRSYRFKKGSGLPIRIPVVEMVEIGAGGGSLASVDRLGRIQVGPQSAGSEPGPACYGRGGTHATVTDADVVLDRLDPARFAGGTLHLDVEAARAVVQSDVAKPWGQEAEDGVATAAHAISEVVDENMAAAARAHAAEWGKEINSRTLIAFGGAAPIHAANIAEKLELDAVLVPPAAGVGSAVGFLAAPVSYEVVRSRYLRLSAFEPGVMEDVMADMRTEAEAVVGPVAQGEVTESVRAYMRYVGQGFEIAVDVEDGTADSLRQAFDAAYKQLYGRLIPGLDVEVLSWTLTLQAGQPAHHFDAPARSREPVSASGADRIARDELSVGDRLVGPVAIVEDQTTTVVPRGFEARVDRHGNVILRREP